MAIPSEEEFDEILELLSNFNAQEILTDAESVEFSFDSIRDFYMEIYNLVSDKRIIINQSPVNKWLQDPPVSG